VIRIRASLQRCRQSVAHRPALQFAEELGFGWRSRVPHSSVA